MPITSQTQTDKANFEFELVNSAAGTDWMHVPVSDENYMSRGFFGFMQALLGGDVTEFVHPLVAAVQHANTVSRATLRAARAA